MSCQWEGRDSLHVTRLANENGGMQATSVVSPTAMTACPRKQLSRQQPISPVAPVASL